MKSTSENRPLREFVCTRFRQYSAIPLCIVSRKHCYRANSRIARSETKIGYRVRWRTFAHASAYINYTTATRTLTNCRVWHGKYDNVINKYFCARCKRVDGRGARKVGGMNLAHVAIEKFPQLIGGLLRFMVSFADFFCHFLNLDEILDFWVFFLNLLCIEMCWKMRNMFGISRWN